MNKLEIIDLCKSFGESRVLSNVSFKISDGEFVAVMGQSGCGKSTLLYCASGMDSPTSGEIVFEGQKLHSLSEKETEKLRLKRMGFIFQKANFLKNLSVADNIVFPAFQLGERGREDIRKTAHELMERLGILDTANHDIHQVSGGQLQRAAACRAMINRPDILFADEPTGALNSSATLELMDIMTKINQDGTTVMLVTHDANAAARADRVIYLEDGRIKDILQLGKFKKDNQLNRTRQMNTWLEIMRF